MREAALDHWILSGCSSETGKEEFFDVVGERIDVLSWHVSEEILEIFFASGKGRWVAFLLFKRSCRSKKKWIDRNES